jgi:hypothetical protein
MTENDEHTNIIMAIHRAIRKTPHDGDEELFRILFNNYIIVKKEEAYQVIKITESWLK